MRAEDINASYEDGILTITVPKAEEEKPKRIEVKATKPVEAKAAEAPTQEPQQGAQTS
jgi:HSP20 family protein